MPEVTIGGKGWAVEAGGNIKEITALSVDEGNGADDGDGDGDGVIIAYPSGRNEVAVLVLNEKLSDGQVHNIAEVMAESGGQALLAAAGDAEDTGRTITEALLEMHARCQSFK